LSIKIGQVGVGEWGKFHCGLLSQMLEAELVGLYHIRKEHIGKTAADFNTREYSSLEKLLEDVQAVVVTSKTATHFEIASQVLKAGKHLFIEKPICTSVEDAESLIKLANDLGLVLQVGHIERFNPGFIAIKKIECTPKFIDVERVGPYSARNAKVSVILDLMIHDLDLILQLINSPVKKIAGCGVSLFSEVADLAQVSLHFENGSTVNIKASRVSEIKSRQMQLTTDDKVYNLDFIKRTASSRTLSTLAIGEAVYLTESGNSKTNLLQSELLAFIDSVEHGSKPTVDGRAGKEALELAIAIQNTVKIVTLKRS